MKTLLLTVVLFFGFASIGKPQGNVQQPGQPTSGPGSPGGFGVRESSYGAGGKQYWIFEPDTAETLPVVVFLHGYGNMDPGIYGGWIDHLAQRGNIVIY